MSKEMDEFNKWFDENLLLKGHHASSSGSQRIWSSAYTAREKIKQFIIDNFIPRSEVHNMIESLRNNCQRHMGDCFDSPCTCNNEEIDKILNSLLNKSDK